MTTREKRRHAAGRVSPPAACRLFSRGVIFTRARVSLALLSLRKNGELPVVYSLWTGSLFVERVKKSRGEGTNREPVQRVLLSSCALHSLRASRKMHSPRLAHKATVIPATRHLGDGYSTLFPGSFLPVRRSVEASRREPWQRVWCLRFLALSAYF